MALIEELEESGSWLFRWRSYLPITFVTAGFYMMLDYRYIGHSATWDRYWDLTCLGVSLLGLLIRCYTIGYTPKNTSGRNAKAQIADTLNTTGIYSLVRNPLYLGNYSMFLGVVLFFHSLPFTLIFTLAFFIYYERIIFAEECYLRRKFGVQYLEWTKHTPAIIPKLQGFRRPNLPFSFRNVLKREYNGFFAVVLTFTLFEVLGELRLHGSWDLGTVRFAFLGAAFLIWATLRTLKKKTSFLHVTDR